LISEILISPLAAHGRGFSGFPHVMLPMDLSVTSVSHSHPSGILQPSTHDLNHFYGRVLVITAYPFQSYNDIAVFNRNGDKIPHEVIPDQQGEGDDLL
jgi:proteasome lid subunit RPN8/RPN11